MERYKFFSRSVLCLLIVVLFELACLSPKPCIAVSFSGFTSFTKTVDRFTLAANVPNTLVGVFSKSQTVAALSLLEQDKLEEARETMAQTILTLAVLDIGGGLVLPIVEKIVNYVKTDPGFANTRIAFRNLNEVLKREFGKPGGTNIDQNAIQKAKEAVNNKFKLDIDSFPRLSKVGKAVTKVTKWFKATSVLEILGPLTDTVSIGFNIWGLVTAIRENDPIGIATNTLGIAGGLVGLSTFVAAVVTGSAILGPIGALVGAFLGLVATFVELFFAPRYDKAAVEIYKQRLGELRKVRDACKDRIDQRMEFLELAGSPYSDVYVINQAGCISTVRKFDMEMKDFVTESKTSFYDRTFRAHIIEVWPEAQEEILDDQYLEIGSYNFLGSPLMPSSTDGSLTIEHGMVGFDFYGKFKPGTDYGGVHVFVDSDIVSNPDFELRGIEIDTAKQYGARANSPDIAQNDVISIGDYKNLRKKQDLDTYEDLEERVEIQVKTRFGYDCLNINGMIGKFESEYENKLAANLGDGGNVLSFQGITRDRSDIKGVFFYSKLGVLKYYHGQDRDTHSLGTVRNVGLLNGSPFDDHVILYSANFKVVQIGGSNVYEFNCDDLAVVSSEPRQFQIIDHSSDSPKLNLITTSPEITANDVILQNRKLKVFDTTGQSPKRIFEVLLETASTANLLINNANSRPINLEHINPVLITGERRALNFRVTERSINYPGGEKNDILFLKWRINQERNYDSYHINMQGGIDYVVISDKYLLEPCGIDGESVALILRHGGFKGGSASALIRIDTQPGSFGNGFYVYLWNTEKIINEYGDVLYEIPSTGYFDQINLYDRYIEVTRETLNTGIETNEDLLVH